MSEGTFYAWKSKYGDMTVSDAKRLKALEDENAKLKKLLAEHMLDAAAMKDLLSKKWQGLTKSVRLLHILKQPTTFPSGGRAIL